MRCIWYYRCMKSFWFIVLSSCILSVISAIAADIWLSQRIAFIGSFAGLQYTLNPGIAWGIRLPTELQEILIGVALLAVLYMALQAIQQNSKFKTRVPSLTVVAYACILGGGTANIIDRIRDGYVTDFVQIGSFPIFNVADSFVTVGVVILFVEAVLVKKELGIRN